MLSETKSDGQEQEEAIEATQRLEDRSAYLVWAGFAFACLQSVCSFAIAASGLRFVFGLGAFLLAIVTSAPVQEFHQDLIRVPMLIFSVAGASVNLALLWQMRWLRNRPAAKWRQRPLTPKRKRLESLQLWLSLSTLLLVALEEVLHHHLHGVYF